jgi:hypothetical protein
MTNHPKPFRDLSDAEKGALLLAHHEGKRIEVHTGSMCEGWFLIDRPSWTEDYAYRIAHEPLIPDSIDWGHVAPGCNYMARDKGGVCYLYEVPPRLRSEDWGSTNCDDVVFAGAFASYRRGTVDWKDSLVIRPGHEVKP